MKDKVRKSMVFIFRIPAPCLCSSGVRPSPGPHYLGSELWPDTFLGGSAVLTLGGKGHSVTSPESCLGFHGEVRTRWGHVSATHSAQGRLVGSSHVMWSPFYRRGTRLPCFAPETEASTSFRLDVGRSSGREAVPSTQMFATAVGLGHAEHRVPEDEPRHPSLGGRSEPRAPGASVT